MTTRSGRTLRQATEKDVPQVMELVRSSSFLQCHTEHTYWILLRYGQRYTLVAEDDAGVLEGYISGVRSTTDPQGLFIWQLVVKPDQRRSRLGYELLSGLTDRASADGCTYFHAAIDIDNEALFALLNEWARCTGRRWEQLETIAYQVDYGDGPVVATENLVVIRRTED